MISELSAAEVVERASEAGLRLVRFLWCGNDGTVRAKAPSLRRGHDNREAPLRVPSFFWGMEEDTCNVQLKAGDASCNPYWRAARERARAPPGRLMRSTTADRIVG